MQSKDELLAKLQKVERVEDKEESTMPRRPYCTIDSQSVIEVYNVSVSSNSHGISFRMLIERGYDGKGLGINGQGMTNPIEVVERLCYVVLDMEKEKLKNTPRSIKQYMIQ